MSTDIEILETPPLNNFYNYIKGIVWIVWSGAVRGTIIESQFNTAGGARRGVPERR